MRPKDLDFYSLVEVRPEQGLIQFCGRRSILVHADAMGALRKELVETLGQDAAKVILTRYGFSCGYEDAGLLAGYMNPKTLEDFVLGGPRVHMFTGIADVEPHIVEIDRDRGHFRMEGFWRHSYEAEQHLRLFGISKDAVCWTLAGYASGFASYVFDADMIGIERECEGQGHERCSWTLMNADGVSPELAELKKYFQPLNIAAQINLLEGKVYERTRELEASEQRYRDLIEDLPEIVFALHSSGKLLHLNKAGRTRLGITPEQVPGLQLRDMVFAPYRAVAANFLKQAATLRTATKLDVVMGDSHGRGFPVRLQVEPVFKDDKIVGYSGLAIDIAAQQERERTLTERASRLETRERQIQEVISDAVYILGLDGCFSFVNQRMANLLGISAAQAVGRAPSEFFARNSAARIAKDFKRRLAGEPVTPFEIALRAPNAERFLLEVSTALLTDDGAASGVIGVARDISARREMERQLARANRLTALGQFASGIAHEINNPLGLVSGFAEEMQCVLDAMPAAAQGEEWATLRRGLGTILDQAHRCKHITQNLLLFSRKQTPPLEPLNLTEFIRQQLAAYRDGGLTKGVAVDLAVTADLPLVPTNPTLLDQVFLNLLKNACDAMEGQGRIVVTIARTAQFAEVEIADEGPGLAPGVIEHIWDPFFTTKAPGRGTGLGLSICYGIMADLRGKISCGNRTERGAWFKMSLPLDEDVGEEALGE